MTQLKPSIFEYDDYRKYLVVWMAWKQGTGSFSKRWFAKRAGFGAPNAWQVVVSGSRNLSHKSVSRFAVAMELTNAEERYFTDLVFLNQTESPKERLEYLRRVAGHPERKKRKPTELAHLEVFRNWLGPVLFEMTGLNDFDDDAHAIAKRLRFEVTPVEVHRALESLIKAKLLRRTPGGKLEKIQADLDAPDGIADLHFHAYHQQALGRAADALDQVPAAERYFSVYTAAIPQSAVAGLREITQRYEDEAMRFIEGVKEPKGEIVQIGFQFFPLLRSPNKSTRRSGK